MPVAGTPIPDSQEHGPISMTPEMEAEETEGAPASPLPREIHLCGAIQLLNSLTSTSYTTRCFPVKWQSIRGKLEQLSSGLTAAARGTAADGNSALMELLQAISSTAEETQLLAERCSDESYLGGKLHLRSDLDVAAAKLELHIKRLSDIYAAGMLTHSRAIILSRPGAGASREDMRSYVKDLFSRLRIGDSEMRARALAALNEILIEDERYARIVAVETVDGLGLLVSLVEFGEMGIQDEALEAISVVAGLDCYRGGLVAAGAVAPLVRALEMGSESGKEKAARALKNLTQNSDNSWSVSAHGGVPALLKICGGVGSSGELISSACDVLRNLSGVGEIKRFMVDEGVVPALVLLSRSKEELTQIQAIEFLNSLAFEDENIKQRVVREGLIESLVHILDPNSPPSSKAREVALRAIPGFCLSSANSMTALISTRFLDRLLLLLRNGETSVQESAIKAAFGFCRASEEAAKAMGDAGFIPELVRLLEARSFEVREMAAEALCSMVSIQRNRRKLIQEEHNVNRILQLLDPDEEKSVTKKSLLSVLMSLTDSSSGRRRVANSGYVKNLEKLEETDAKKIIKKLSTNRFRSILTGIWGSLSVTSSTLV